MAAVTTDSRTKAAGPVSWFARPLFPETGFVVVSIGAKLLVQMVLIFELIVNYDRLAARKYPTLKIKNESFPGFADSQKTG